MSVYQISRAAEIGHCADIWLAASIEAHAFISSAFWQDRWRMMKEPICLLPRSMDVNRPGSWLALLQSMKML